MGLYKEIETTQPIPKEKSIIGDAVTTSNIFLQWAENQTGDRKIQDKAVQAERAEGIKFSWTSDKTKEMIKGLPDEIVDSIDPDIDSYEALRASIARIKGNAESQARIQHKLGTWGSMGVSVLTGTVTDPITFLTAGGGSAITVTRGFNRAMGTLTKAQKSSLGFTTGAATGYAYEEAYQATTMEDDETTKLFAAAFGGTLGGLAGYHTVNLPVEQRHIEAGKTPSEVVAESITTGTYKDAVNQVKQTQKAPVLKTPIGSAYAPATRLLSHDNDKVRDIAGSLINPPVAMRDVVTDKPIVSGGRTAQDIKADLIGEHNNMLIAVNELHTKEKKSGGFTGSYNEFLQEVHKSYVESKAKAEREIWDEIPYNNLPELPKGFEIPKGSSERAERVKLYLRDKELNIKYEHSNASVARAAQHVADYFNRQAKNLKESGMKGMEYIKPNGHLPRSFNANKMEADKEGFVRSLVEAMSRHPENSGVTPEELRKSAEGVYESVLDAHYFRNVTEHSKPATTSTKKRSLKYSDADMYDWLNKDLGLITSKYSHDTAGTIALQKSLGVSNKSELHQMLKDKFGRDIDEATYKDLEVAFDTIKGTREIPRSQSMWDHTLRIGTKTSRAIFSPGFALAGMAEFATPVATNGFVNTMKALLPGFKTTIDLVRGNSINNPVVKELQQFGLVGKILESRQLNRYDTDDTMHAPIKGFAGKFEETLDKTNHFIHKYMGLGFVTEAAQVTTMVSGLNFLNQMAKRVAAGVELKGNDVKALSRLGISREDLLELHSNMKQHCVEKYGQVQELNINKWNPELVEKVTTALERNIKSTVLEPDGINLPIWMSDPNSVISRVMMQFTRYPMSAYTMLTMKGLDEVSAKQIISIGLNISILGAIAQIKDLAREKPLFDTNTEEGKRNLYTYMATNTYITGALSPIMEKILSLGGYSTGKYSPSVASTLLGPVGAVLQGAQTTGKSLLTDDPKVSRAINPVEHAWFFGMFMEFWNNTLGEDVPDAGIHYKEASFTPNVKPIKDINYNIHSTNDIKDILDKDKKQGITDKQETTKEMFVANLKQSKDDGYLDGATIILKNSKTGEYDVYPSGAKADSNSAISYEEYMRRYAK